MKIISGFKHPSTFTWNMWIDNLKLSAERFGHEVMTFDLPTTDVWIAGHYELYLSLCWKYKIVFLQEAVNTIKDDLLWIDGDCLVMKEINYDDIMSDCDVALTLRDVRDRCLTSQPDRDGLINSGVIFLKNTIRTRQFLQMCRNQLLISLYDQEAINRVLLKKSKIDRHQEIITLSGIKIKILSCREYNNFYFDSTTDNAKIVHFKSQGRQLYNNYVKGLC